MCYGYGLRENELNEASPRFVSLFLQGNSERDYENSKTHWEQARLVASAFSKTAGKIKFPWEVQTRGPVDIPQEVWDRFTLPTGGKQIEAKDIKKYIN